MKNFLLKLQRIELALDLGDPRKTTHLKKCVRSLKALIAEMKKTFTLNENSKIDTDFDQKITQEMMK